MAADRWKWSRAKVLALVVPLLFVDLAFLSADQQRAEVERLGSGFVQVVFHMGFMEELDVPRELSAIDDQILAFDPDQVTYFLGSETVISAAGDGMTPWREHLFALQNQTASSASRFFNLPSEKVFEVGSHVEI